MRNLKLNSINFALFNIIVLALVLRMIYLGSKSLWLDEAANLLMAEQSFFSWTNTLPPFYFAFLHFWLAFGKSEVILRFPSVILGVLSVYIIFRIGTILYGEKEGLISAFLLSISQTAIFFSQNALYYSFFIPFSLLSVYFFLKMEEKSTKSNKFLFLGSIVLNFYTHYFSLLILIAFIIFKIIKYKKDADLKEIKSFFRLIVIFILLIAPIIPIFISETFSRSEASYNDFQFQTHLSIDFLSGIFTYLNVNSYYDEESMFLQIMAVLFLLGLICSLKNLKKTEFLLMWLFLPIIFAAIITDFISNLHIRYLIFILPALLLICSHGIVNIPNLINNLFKKNGEETKKLNSLLIVLILMIVILSSIPNLEYYYKSENYNWRGAAEFLEENAEDGSNVVLVPGFNSIPFNYYYKPEHKINVWGYSTIDNFIKLSFQNNTYLVITNDAYTLEPNDLEKLRFWLANKMEKKIELSSIYIYKNITFDDTVS